MPPTVTGPATRRSVRWLPNAALVVMVAVLPACRAPANNDDLLPATEGPAPTAEIAGTAGTAETVETAETAETTISVTPASMPFDRRILGTNLPAWLGTERLTDPAFQDEALASGTTMVRMPGGSWSNSYDWLACELRDEDECFFTWAARPSDFISFMDSTGLDGMWTASINDTAESAAAAVAFFNGTVDDSTAIGTDRNGTDWMTVGTWAQLRADRGYREPVPIQLWEVGNEVFGGKPSAGGSQCASFGWETVWTCDGTDYVEGTLENDGFLQFREAMLAVDPTIEVGAVGVGEPGSWNEWGREVINGADGEMDFYVVHDYGFNDSPDLDDLVSRPGEHWPGLMNELRAELDAEIPVAVTEYNLVAFQDGDTDQTMATAANALYFADTIGQLALNGVAIANQWNLANGTAENGTDYGMLNLDDGSRRPQFYAMAAWAQAGDRILPAIDLDEVRLYPTVHEDGTVTLIALNRSGRSSAHRFRLSNDTTPSTLASGDIVAAVADAPDATTMVLSEAAALEVVDGVVAVTLPPWSISAVELST